MYRIKTLNKISTVGLGQLSKDQFQVGTDMENEDGILVRSAPMQDYVFPNALRAIARAGAGTNNIPIDRCSENGIVVFNTPGANANAVKELVIAALLIASRDIIGGNRWVMEQAAAGVDPGRRRGEGQVCLCGAGAVPQDPGRHRSGGHRRPGVQRRSGAGHGRVRLRPLPVCGRRPPSGPPCPRGEGRERPVPGVRLCDHPCALQQGHEGFYQRRCHRQDEGAGPGAESGPGRTGERRRYDRRPAVRPYRQICHRFSR